MLQRRDDALATRDAANAVLQELERMRVPIDAIAGTSMGAIVGGLYATGMSPKELEELVTTLDWVASMRDTPSREHLVDPTRVARVRFAGNRYLRTNSPSASRWVTP